MATETLSEYLERDISAASIFDIKLKVQDKTRYYRKFQRLSVVTSAGIHWLALGFHRLVGGSTGLRYSLLHFD